MNTDAIDQFFGEYKPDTPKSITDVIQEYGSIIASHRTQSRQHIYLCTRVHQNRSQQNLAQTNAGLYEQFAEYQTQFATMLIELHKADTKKDLYFVLEGLDPQTLQVSQMLEAKALYNLVYQEYSQRSSTGSSLKANVSPLEVEHIHALYDNETIFLAYLLQNSNLENTRPGRPDRAKPWGQTVLQEVKQATETSPKKLAEFWQKRYLQALQQDWHTRHAYIRSQIGSKNAVVSLGGAHFATLHETTNPVPLPYIEQTFADCNYDIVQLPTEPALIDAVKLQGVSGINPLAYTTEELAQIIQG